MKVAGPFLGEFGWEVMMWVPHLRWLVKEGHCNGGLHVVCRRGHTDLYPFAHKTTEIDVPVRKVDCEHAWVEGVEGRLRREHYRGFAETTLEGRLPSTRFISPDSMQYDWPPDRAPRLHKGDFTPYKQPAPFKNRVGLHIRACESKQPERNWDPGLASEVAFDLKERGIELFTFGSLDGAERLPEIPVHNDMRGKPLREVMVVLASCAVVLGPSSGPLHLANACGAPVLWWSKNVKDVDRYCEAWNPWGLPNSRVKQDWQPSSEEITKAFDAWRKR